jgi:serralysin
LELPVPTSWSLQQIIDNLNRAGLTWSGSTISFGFPSSAPSGASGEAAGFSAFGAEQKAAARLALTMWDDVMSPDFKETALNPDITFNNTTTSIGYAHAYFPGSWGAAGSVWMNPNYNSGTSDLVTPAVGDWGFKSFMHEIGHALGLEHPGEYPSNYTYANDAPYRQDTFQFTIMSYFSETNTGADWVASNGWSYSPQTPMMHDIAAIQALYGAETSTRTGNTVYGFNSNANRDVYDFEKNAHPILCIWDAGGNDTLDFSGFTQGTRLDLRPGTFSDCDAMTKNVSIAVNAWIERAEGGSAADTIIGNTRSNVIDGNNGSDTINGGYGIDYINGGNGNDRLVGSHGDDRLTGGAGADRFVFSNGAKTWDVVRDFQDGIDKIVFAGSAADAMSDIAILGQGTESIRLTVGDDVIVVKSTVNIWIGAADIIFE